MKKKKNLHLTWWSFPVCFPDRFSDDILFMTGKRPNIYWKACWLVISPVMLLAVLIAYVALQAQTRPTYPTWNPAYVSQTIHHNRTNTVFAHFNVAFNICVYVFFQELFPQTETRDYPDWVFAIIILLCVIPVISIPLVALYRLICCGIKRSSPRAELNSYSNGGFEIEVRQSRTQST